MAFSGFLSQGNKQFSSKERRLAPRLYLLAGICRLGTNQQLSSLSFVFVNSWRGEEDSRVPTALMAVLMPLMCDLGQQRRNLPKHSILNYYQSLPEQQPTLMTSSCQMLHPPFNRSLLGLLNLILHKHNLTDAVFQRKITRADRHASSCKENVSVVSD